MNNISKHVLQHIKYYLLTLSLQKKIIMEKEIELVACERCEKEFDSDYINNDFNGIFCPACQDELLQDDKDMRDTYKTC